MAFKMKGHELPGIKQRPSSKTSDGKAGSSAFQAKEDPKNSTSETENLLQNLKNFGTQEEKARMTKYGTLGDAQAYLNPEKEVGKSAGGAKRQAELIKFDAKNRASSARSQEKRDAKRKESEAIKAEIARKNALTAKEKKAEAKAKRKAAKNA